MLAPKVASLIIVRWPRAEQSSWRPRIAVSLVLNGLAVTKFWKLAVTRCWRRILAAARSVWLPTACSVALGDFYPHWHMMGVKAARG